MKEQRSHHQEPKDAHGTESLSHSRGGAGMVEEAVTRGNGSIQKRALATTTLNKDQEYIPKGEHALKANEGADTKTSAKPSKDMVSDSWLSKNVRPLSLLYLTLCATLFVVLDSAIDSFAVEKAWIGLLNTISVSNLPNKNAPFCPILQNKNNP